MAKPLIRDFIYLDVERVRSFVAQASGGLTSERTYQAQQEVGGEGQVVGRFPLIAQASASGDYHYSRSHSETKSLHDHIFAEFYGSINEEKRLLDLSGIYETAWVEALFKDSSFIMVRGLLKIVDYQLITATIQGLPKLLETTSRISELTSQAKVQGNTNPQSQSEELQKLRTQLPGLPIQDIINFINQVYGDLVRIKVFPFQSRPEKLFVGTADRALFRYSPGALVNLYGSVIDAKWVSVLQVNKGTYHAPGQMVSKMGNEMEDSLEQLADIISSLSDLTQGVKFPAVAVTPIAIYREIATNHS